MLTSVVLRQGEHPKLNTRFALLRKIIWNGIVFFFFHVIYRPPPNKCIFIAGFGLCASCISDHESCHTSSLDVSHCLVNEWCEFHIYTRFMYSDRFIFILLFVAYFRLLAFPFLTSNNRIKRFAFLRSSVISIGLFSFTFLSHHSGTACRVEWWWFDYVIWIRKRTEWVRCRLVVDGNRYMQIFWF